MVETDVWRKETKTKRTSKNYSKANRIKKGLISSEFNSVRYVFFVIHYLIHNIYVI